VNHGKLGKIVLNTTFDGPMQDHHPLGGTLPSSVWNQFPTNLVLNDFHPSLPKATRPLEK
jgi:hypothetical protein